MNDRLRKAMEEMEAEYGGKPPSRAEKVAKLNEIFDAEDMDGKVALIRNAMGGMAHKHLTNLKSAPSEALGIMGFTLSAAESPDDLRRIVGALSDAETKLLYSAAQLGLVIAAEGTI